MGQCQMCMGYENSQLGMFGPIGTWIFSVAATSLGIAGLFTNQMINMQAAARSNSDNDMYCGYKEIWQYRLDGQEYFAQMYRYYCNTPEALLPGEFQIDYCQTASCGITWIILGGFACLLGMVSILMTLKSCCTINNNYGMGGMEGNGCTGCSRFLELFSTIFCVSAIVAWFFNNDICWNEIDRDNGLVEIGPSIWFMMSASICFLIACIFRFI